MGKRNREEVERGERRRGRMGNRAGENCGGVKADDLGFPCAVPFKDGGEGSGRVGRLGIDGGKGRDGRLAMEERERERGESGESEREGGD